MLCLQGSRIQYLLPASPQPRPGAAILKHWILEASGGSLPTRGRASPCARESVGGLRQDWQEAPHGALLAGAENHRDGPAATARCRLAGLTTRPADLGKRAEATIGQPSKQRFEVVVRRSSVELLSGREFDQYINLRPVRLFEGVPPPEAVVGFKMKSCRRSEL